MKTLGKYVLVNLTLFGAFMQTGILYGWPSLEEILVHDGEYAELCLPETHPCREQYDSLLYIYTVGISVHAMSALPAGYLIDGIGHSASLIPAGIMQVAGYILLAVSESMSKNYFRLAFGLLGVGSQITLFAAYPAAFLIPSMQSTVLTGVSSLYVAGPAVFVLFRYANEFWAVSRRDMFLFYAAASGILYAVLSWLWSRVERVEFVEEGRSLVGSLHGSVFVYDPPRLAITQPTAGTTPNSLQTPPSQDPASLQVPDETHGVSLKDSVPVFVDHETLLPFQKRSADEQISSRHFAFFLFFVAVCMVRGTVFVEAANQTLIAPVLHEYEYALSWAFGLLLPAGAVAMPLLHTLVARTGMVPCVLLSCLLGTAYPILQLLPAVWAQVAAWAVFSVYRAAALVATTALAAEVFGLDTLGTVLALAVTMSSAPMAFQAPILASLQSSGAILVVVLSAVLLAATCIYLWDGNAKESSPRLYDPIWEDAEVERVIALSPAFGDLCYRAAMGCPIFHGTRYGSRLSIL